jgi:hypothetical protein
VTATTGGEGGKKPGSPEAAYGLILSNQTLADGTLTADIVFEKATPETIGELVVSYDSNASQLVAAGLGGPIGGLYSIREFGGRMAPGNWWYYRWGGDRSALQAGKTYAVEARFRGDAAALYIDGVAVAEGEVSAPTGRARQVGLFCKGNHEITIRNFSVKSSKPKAFVIMQFGGEYESVYRDVISEVCHEYDVSALRADEVSGPGLVIGDIVREITGSQLIIADITPANANVYFEVGYSIARGKATILLAKKGTPLPFDVAGFRVLFYEDTIGGKKRLEEALGKHVAAILESPVTSPRPLTP